MIARSKRPLISSVATIQINVHPVGEKFDNTLHTRSKSAPARYMLLILSNEIKGNHGAHMKAEFLEKQTNIYIEKKSVSYMDLARF
jgi:hypothetical protein